MSYPNYPNNRLVVGGVDLTTQYQLILMDGYSLSPPEPKTYIVDIPGGNGKLDLTETLLGDTAYGDRKQEFTFYVINAQNFESTKTQVSNYLHGKAFDYTMTMDPEYTYHGRFSVTGYEHHSSSMGKIGVIKISIDSDPFKRKEDQVLLVNAVGGKICIFPSGRRRVRPIIQTSRFLTVITGNKQTRLPLGSWAIEGMYFTHGDNEVYFNSYPVHSITWHNLKTDPVTWEGFKENRLFEWYKSNGLGDATYDDWSDISENTWGNLSVSAWADLVTITGVPGGIGDIYVKYDWSDL